MLYRIHVYTVSEEKMVGIEADDASSARAQALAVVKQGGGIMVRVEDQTYVVADSSMDILTCCLKSHNKHMDKK